MIENGESTSVAKPSTESDQAQWERITVNPMGSIDKRSGSKKKFEVRLEEPVEDVLIAVCDQLNRPQHRPHSVAPQGSWTVV